MGYRRNIAYIPQTGKYKVRKESIDPRTGKNRVHKATFRSRENAEDWLRELERKIFELPVEKPSPTIREAAELWQAQLQRRGRSPSTMLYYAKNHRIAQEIIGDERLKDIDQAVIDRYIETRSRMVSGGTINKELADLRRLYTLSEVETEPRWNLERISHDPRVRLVRSPDEVAALWLELSPQARVPVGLCLLAGLRASEATRAEQSWIRREQREVWVPTRKKKDPFKTALVDTLAQILPETGRLVTITDSHLDMELHAASKATGIDPPIRGPGIFRHHCATWGVDYSKGRYREQDASAVLGHHKVGATARYVHTQAVERKRKFLQVVENAFRVALTRRTSKSG